MQNWWTNGDNQIAFSRGSSAFLAINKASYGMNEYLQTGLPAGEYCNVNAGDFVNNACSGGKYVGEGFGRKLGDPVSRLLTCDRFLCYCEQRRDG